jgi:hypothetical protein
MLRPIRSPLLLRRLLGEIWNAYRALFVRLIVAALIVYLPVSLLDGIGAHFSEVETGASVGEVVTAIGVGAAAAVVAVLGEVIYAGIVSALVTDRRSGRHEPLSDVLRSLPFVRLAIADVVYTLIVAGGFLLLIVPGLIFLTWFALVAPAIEIEGRGVKDALRRSRTLVRPHFWKILAIVVPLFTLAGVGGNFLEHLFTGFGDSFLAEWAGGILSEVVIAPFLALFLVITFLELREAPEPSSARR